MRTSAVLLSLVIWGTQAQAWVRPVQRCKRLASSESFVPIPNCSIGDTAYNSWGVRIVPETPHADAVTILYFGGGHLSTLVGEAATSTANAIQERLQFILKKPVRLVDASYESYFPGEPEIPLESLLEEYKPRFTILAYHTGVQAVKAAEQPLIRSKEFDVEGLNDFGARRMIRILRYTRSLSRNPYPKATFLERYMTEIKSIDERCKKHGSQFRFMWNGSGVGTKAWKFWMREGNITWLERLVEPLMLPIRIDRSFFEDKLAATGVTYRWVHQPKIDPNDEEENASALSFGTAVANDLFTREDWQ